MYLITYIDPTTASPGLLPVTSLSCEALRLNPEQEWLGKGGSLRVQRKCCFNQQEEISKTEVLPSGKR